MQREIERKFLLNRYPEAEIRKGEVAYANRMELEQTYLAFSGHEEFRVRRIVIDGKEERYTHTYKRGQGLNREEQEIEISEGIYRQLLGNLNKTPLLKTRTTLEWQGYTVEVDDYSQISLTTVEVEFESEEQAKAFTPPEWFGREIGGEEEYRVKKLWVSLQQPTTE